MNIQLFINKLEVELNESISFPITKTFDDINNPTTIINDYSKTILVPFSEHNNKLFGELFRADRAIVADNSQLIGVNFDPTKKNDFILLYNDLLVMSGYAKVNDIVKNNGTGHYNITLCGTLGKVFQEYQKITFDKHAADEDPTQAKYIINGTTYVNEVISKENVKASWDGTSTSMIGYAFDNSFSGNFDYKTYQYASALSTTFESTLETKDFLTITGLEPSTVINEGLLPRDIGECRSYLNTIPYIHIKDLFEVFTDKANTLTDYSINLDSGWFNDENPYWNNLVCTLKKFDLTSGGTYENNYSNCKNNSGNSNFGEWQISNNYTTTRTNKYVPGLVTYEKASCYRNNHYYINNIDHNNLIFQVKFNVNLQEYEQGGDLKLNKNNGLRIDMRMVGQTGEYQTVKYLIIDDESSLTEDGCNIIKTVKFENSNPNYINLILEANYFITDKETYGDYVDFYIDAYWLYNTYPVSTLDDHTPSAKVAIILMADSSKSITRLVLNDNNLFRSYSHFTLNDLWNNDYKLFDQILNYCKMYHLLVYIDEMEKEVVFIKSTDYFSNYSIEDWTDKIDLLNDYEIVTPAFDSKYILFNYKDDSTKIGKEYLSKYGYDFGERKIITDYNFNSDTNSIFSDNIYNSINNTDNILSWSNLYEKQYITYSFPAEKYVYSKDENNKYVEKFGSYYFYNGLASFDTEEALNLRQMHISDDTAFQLANNTYFYSQNENSVAVNTYPKLDIIKDGKCCLFNIPNENYTYENNYENKLSIYDQFWKSYIEERYNIQNKIVTCYINLKPMDYINFSFNKFVYILNRLYMVNKIYDYDITSNAPTKVDLITISNINAYTGNN